MKSLFLHAAVTLFVFMQCFFAYGQNVRITYSETIPADAVTCLSLKLDNKLYLKIGIQSDFPSGKEFHISCYQCIGQEVSKRDYPFRTTCTTENPDSLVIEVMMQQVQDSVSLAFALDGMVEDLMLPTRYRIPSPDGLDRHYILMETELDTPLTLSDEIPLFAVTSGICKEIDWNGQKATLQDYCGLRDKHIHPKEWKETEGVGNYYFYTISFQ